MISRVGVELAERFSTQHDSEELARVIERARLLEEIDALRDESERWAHVGGGNPHTLAIAARMALKRREERLQELAQGTDYDAEARS